MRKTQSFLLRLVVDPAAPRRLRGLLQALPEGAERRFRSKRALLALLEEALRKETAQGADSPAAADSLALQDEPPEEKSSDEGMELPAAGGNPAPSAGKESRMADLPNENDEFC